MALSDRRRPRAALAIASSLGVVVLAACNGILGIDGFRESEDGGSADSGGSDVIVGGDATVDGGGGVDGDATTGVDVIQIVLPEGSAPATWARWKMPDRVTGSPNTPSYTLDNDGGVIDNVTGLLWMQGDITAASPTFADAKAACDKVPNGPWRVPTRIELVSLLDHVTDAGAAPQAPAIDSNYFKASKSQYWTASPVLPAPGVPLATPVPFWLVDFTDGSLTTTSDHDTQFVRCVKGGS